MPAMKCFACLRGTLGLPFRSIFDSELTLLSRTNTARNAALSRPFSTARRQLQLHRASRDDTNVWATKESPKVHGSAEREKERPAWQAEKEAVKRKLNGEAWNPRKKLSPDTMEGIRHLHKTQPTKFTTPVLAQYFQVSPEAIKRILRSKWRPSDEEQEDKLRRWDKRGEHIWTNLVELGVKPPKKWRDMGVGRSRNGEKPRWKSGSRNQVVVKDSFGSGDFGWAEEDLIPIVDGKSATQPSRKTNIPFSDRIGI
ncbi:Required for respiratory growth protein 9 mitochondrial [Paraconiothyrium brasiliense]|uniref:Required for respiratory growth protein 9, mitochondrial n=1 Tax=Paraconiothyrium brasiliense TaxID=300254 RepID=A0ABR3RRB7_9PLEO